MVRITKGKALTNNNHLQPPRFTESTPQARAVSMTLPKTKKAYIIIEKPYRPRKKKVYKS